MPRQLYVSLQNDDRIARFELDPESGRLVHVGDTEAPGGPAPLAVNPTGTALYAGYRGAGGRATGGDGTPRPEFGLSSFVIDQRSGELAPIGRRVQLSGEPCYLSTDRRGRFLLSAYYQAGACAVHPIDESGALGGEAIEWRQTSSGAHCFQVDSSNRFAFVPHIAEGSGGLQRLPEERRTAANAIFQFQFDQETGSLTPNDPPKTGPAERIGPRHFCFHSTKPLLYVDNEQGSSVTVYALDPERGTLTPGKTTSTLPAGFSGRNACSQIRIHPSGRFLYISNRGHNSIASFAVDATTGDLTPTGWAAAERVPRAFALDPTGNFLYAAGLDTGNLTGYRIDQQAGTLTPIETHPAGNLPMWVLIIELPGH